MQYCVILIHANTCVFSLLVVFFSSSKLKEHLVIAWVWVCLDDISFTQFFFHSIQKVKASRRKNNSSRILLFKNLYNILGIIHILRVCALVCVHFVIISKGNFFHLDIALKIIGNILFPYSKMYVCLKGYGILKLPLIDFCQVAFFYFTADEEFLFYVDSNEKDVCRQHDLFLEITINWTDIKKNVLKIFMYISNCVKITSIFFAMHLMKQHNLTKERKKNRRNIKRW